MDEMDRWISRYEKRRTSGFEGSDKALLSSRVEIRDIPTPEVGENMTFGKSCQALKKTWYHLKRNRAEGNYNNRDLELRINRIQNALGFERTVFDDLDQEWVDHELSMEEVGLLSEEELQLKGEEREAEAEDDW
jgi:hypothetical protein